MRGKIIAAMLTVLLVSAGTGSVILTRSRHEARVRTTHVIIKELERDLARERMQQGGYPRALEPAAVDGWGHPIELEVPSPEGLPYRLTSFGADGQPGGRGPNADISNWEI